MTIPLQLAGTDAVALVDDDFAHLRRYRWRLSPKGFVFRHGDRVVKLKNSVFGSAPPGFGVAFANGDQLDNRRENLRCIPLRFVNQGQSAQKRNATGLRGAQFDRSRGKWKAAVTIEGKRRNLGRYDTAEEAAVVAREFRLKNMMYTTDR
jgi:hypothetical protein